MLTFLIVTFIEFAKAMWQGLLIAILAIKVIELVHESYNSQGVYPIVRSISMIGILTYILMKLTFNTCFGV